MNTHSELDPVDQASHLILNPEKAADATLLSKLRRLPLLQEVDEIHSQLAELIKLRNPTEKFTDKELRAHVEKFFRDKDPFSYGNWVYYPWRNCLVHILPEKEFIEVRTVRNKYKITREEQELLSQKVIGVVGLSVGQSVAICLAMERSFGELRIADFDTLELGNMNRIRTGLPNLGLKKTQIVTREIAEIDPYLKVRVFDAGLTTENIDDFFTKGGNLDLLIEECDSLPMKIASRIKARSYGIPVLMDTSDRGMIDVERFDLEPERPVFHGMLEKFGPENQVLNNFEENKSEILMRVLDFEKLSKRAKFSISEIGKTITTWPQLASSVIMGGAMCAYFARLILCKEMVGSGRMYVDLDEFYMKHHEG